MEFQENTDSISDIRFNSVSIGDHRCNINRDANSIILLQNFNDIVPYYDETNGLHIKVYNKETNKTNIIPLNNSVALGMLTEYLKKMNDDQYYEIFVDGKKNPSVEFYQNFLNAKVPIINNLISNTYAKGFEFPSAVQAISIPELITRKDALIQFKSGTGKTHAFLTGLLWGFDPSDNELQYMFITSSHEVASQIYVQAKELLPTNTHISLCIGQKKEGNTMVGGFKTTVNTSSLNNHTKTMKEEREEINNAQVIIGTMGKIYDFLFNKKWVRTLKYLKAICVDEFDNIVSSKSKSRNSTIVSTEEQMAMIIQSLPTNTQRAFFSATVSEESLHIAHSYFRKYSPNIGEPLILLLDLEDYTLEGIKQYYVQIKTFVQKKEVLIDLLKQCRIAQAIIFANTINTARDIENLLNTQDIPFSTAIFHGSLSASTRNSIFEDFKKNKIRILISTDVTARGIDVQGINLVINFDMPDDLQTYIHRVGRSGRYGRKGISISLIICNELKDENKKVKIINECSKNSKMEPLPENLSDLL